MAEIKGSFPGYEYIPAYKSEDGKKHNMYRGIDVGFGGYIISNPGLYGNVAMLDSASHHPSSIIAMNAFGDYTKRFQDILQTRIAIKHKDYEAAKKIFNGKLDKYLDDPQQAKALAQALKIAINSVYGLTAANFDNAFRDKRNENNIVALRGALFMKNLQDEVEARGFKIPAIKTDSIKVADATPEIIQFIMDYGKEYGYTFEHECTYDKCCIINDADYVARYSTKEQCEKMYGYVPGDNFDHSGCWTATGKKFQVPYVFKTLFSKEDILFEDMCETFSVKEGDLYLDMNEGITQPITDFNKELKKIEKDFKNGLITESQKETLEKELTETEAKGHKYVFVGRVGQFCPIKPGCGGGVLYRMKDGKYYAAAGSTGYRFLESEVVKELGKEADIDRVFYDTLVNDAVDAINKFGDFEWFASDEPYDKMLEFIKTVEDTPEELPFE